jgi:hypothetical protein
VNAPEYELAVAMAPFANGPMLGFHDREGFTTPESMKGFAIMGAGRR